MIKKQTLILLVSFMYSLWAFSQISEGGTPPSFKSKNAVRSGSVSVSHIPVNLDIKRLLWEDEMVGRDAPLRVATVIPIHINVDSLANRTTLANSVEILQHTIVAEGAQGMILSYQDFYIPEGAKLYIYNEDHSVILGAYTQRTHPQGGKFATEIIWGDKITLEYVASTASNEAPRIVIESVGYVYNKQAILRAAPNLDSFLNRSEPCMINVNCSEEGNNWRQQQRGVVLFLVQVGAWYGCTGSLINNTKKDATPYVLTANHCFVKDTGFPLYETIIAYFNYEFPGCENEKTVPQKQTMVGTELLVSVPLTETTDQLTIKGSDGALIKFKENIPLDYKPFFNGWDRRDIPATSGVVIHHPKFDVKKIVQYAKTLQTGTYIGDYTGAPNAHWIVEYNGKSVTQEGSSGAPLFNQNGLIVGTLTGGSSRCNNRTGNDYYGKIGYHWDYLKDVNRQMKKYLDPLNTGDFTLKGYDPNNPSGIEEEAVKNHLKELVLFPTPADNEVNVNASSIIRSIKVYDMNGRQVYARSGYNASTATVSVDSWPKAVYTVVVETELKKLTGKFIKK